MTHDDVQRWLDDYVVAWETYDTERIGGLFSAAATCRYHPYDAEPVVGREAIVESWLNEDARDPPGTYDARYQPYVVEGDRAVAVGFSRYYADSSRTALLKEYFNAYLLRFDAEGRCAEFTEYFVLRPS